MSELTGGSEIRENDNGKDEDFSSFRISDDEAKKSGSSIRMVEGGEMISPSESESEQNPSSLDPLSKQIESIEFSEKKISPILWDRSNDFDTVRVYTPENEFSREVEDESVEESKIKTASLMNEGATSESAEIMDPDVLTNFDQLFINTRYFLIKSNNYENVVIAKQNNAWSTPIGNENRLTKAFHESNNVLLIFSVRESGKFQGFARLASPPDSRLKIDWVLPPRMSPDALSHPFKLDWVTKQELPFGNVSHLTNSWNEGKQVKIGRDGQEIEPVCGQALCRSFSLDSAEAILEIVKKIIPKKPKSSDNTRRRVPSDRIGTAQVSSSRRPKDLGFRNPNSVGLLGAATTSRSTVPPLMSSIDLTNLSAVAAMAAMKSNQSRGSLLPPTNPAVDISRLISSSTSGVLPHLVPQVTGTDPATISTLLSTHGAAINRIFQQDAIHQPSLRQRSRERRHRSRSSSGESDRYHRDCHRERRRHRDEEDSYRYRSRYSREDSRGCHYGESHRAYRRSRDRSISPSRATAFLNWNYEDYLKEVQRGMNPNLSSLIDGVVQSRIHGVSDADRQFDERVNAFLRNNAAPTSSGPHYSNDVYRDYERDSRSRSASSEERHYRRRRKRGRSRDGDSHQRSCGDSRRRYEDNADFEEEAGIGDDGYRSWEHRRSSHLRSRSRFYRGDEVDDTGGRGDGCRDGIKNHHVRYHR